MSGEIVVPETPNWLNDLEAKREKRLKARLGHEAGAGAPCLKCGDKCPGLDLHFWRKACKVCRCPKEEHDVPDDDIYGWAQFQLLGSKPNRIKTKIVLPGKNDEVELEWAPKGQKETIDKYLKTLPPEALPVKGSQAAQERKQLLQKQIPVHDIDPALCHELNDEEVTKMEEYIAHVKKSSVGVGQIVNLSSVIKANLHNISPQEAHIIASRYSTGIPFSEIVKLQAGLAQNLENLSLTDPKNRKNQAMQPGGVVEDNVQHSLPTAKFKDITHPWYTNSGPGKGPLNPQYSENFKSQNLQKPQQSFNYSINDKLLEETNFDPSKTPSQFLGYYTPGYRPNQHGGQFQDQFNQQGIKYDNSSFQPLTDVSYSSGIDKSNPLRSGPLGEQAQGQYGFENPCFNQNRQGYTETQDPKAPKSVKDLIYSTYDSSKGPIPQDHYGSRNMDSTIAGYDPDAVFNTYKHDPSVIRHEPSQLCSKHPENFDAKRGLRKFDPVTGKYIPEDHRYPEPGHEVVRDNKNYQDIQPTLRDLSKVDPITGKHILEDDGYGKHGLRKFDPVTGRYIPEDHRYPEPGHEVVRDNKNYQDIQPTLRDLSKVDPITGKHILEDDGYGKHGLRKFDPVTGRYIPEDHRYPEPGHEVVRDNKNYQVIQPTLRGLSKVDPITGKHILEDDGYAKHGLRKFDPVTGQHIPEADRYPEPSREVIKEDEHYQANLHGLPKFDPVTGRYVSEELTGNINDVSRGYQYPYGIDISSGQPLPHDKGIYAPGNKYRPNAPFELEYTRKPLSALQPSHMNVPEDYLEPQMVNVGAIQDINPEIKAATAELNPGFDKESVYSDNGAEYSPESIREILNNIKLPDCHYCKKSFDENEFAVTIDRANVLFHAQCFKCAGCNQSLADNIYFYNKDTDNVYCGRDYAKIKGYPRCTACDELIFTKEYCLAENATFHLKHFCCLECDTPLAGQDYTLEDEKPYCLPCYESSKAAKCSTCEHVIKPDEVGCQLNGVHFHAEDRCFRCIVCSLPLMGKKMLLRNRKLYCSHDCFKTGKSGNN